MNDFKPYYLYFLDRELLSTLDLYGRISLEAVLHEIIICLLSTPLQSYCSLSLVFESDYANAIYHRLLPLFISGHIVLNMSGAKSISIWAEKKQRQYNHSNKQRYHRYMTNVWEQIAEKSPIIRCRSVDTTKDLSKLMSNYLTIGKQSEFAKNISIIASPNEIELLTRPIIDTIEGRGEKAITKELFIDIYKQFQISKETMRIYDLSVSIQYVSSQIKEFGATIPVNGKLPIHEFDDLSINWPLNDLNVWVMAYKQLGLYRDLITLGPKDLVTFRESEQFTPLLERIAKAISCLNTIKFIESVVSIKNRLKSKKWTALARSLQNSKILLSTDWPYDQIKKKRKINMANPPESKKVFVVHGRNLAARDAIFSVLNALGLQPIEWTQALNAANEPSPYIGDVIENAMKKAQAIVVLLTGDDEAKLRSEFLAENDGDHERNLTPQPRPNVLFEAGMALGLFPIRTILLAIGQLRQFSDIQGRHVLRWSNEPESRHALAERLRTAGCEVDTTGSRWLKAGLL